MSDNVRVDITDLRKTIAILRTVDKTAGREIARAMKVAAEPMVATARAKSPMKKLTPTIKVKASQKAVYLHAGSPKKGTGALAAAVEFGGGRHPLFGNRGYWYPIEHRPYLTPARNEHIMEFAEAVADAVAKSLVGHGLA